MRKKDFDGKMIYITGGSSGMGLEMGKIFAARGASLLLIARNQARLDAAREAMEPLCKRGSQTVATLSLDVSDPENVEPALKQAVADFGAPDILITGAGINKYADHFENITPAMFEEVMRINVGGVRNVIYALLEPLKQHNGHIVIFSSAAALFGMFGYTAYATSKGALMSFAESLRYELKPLGMPVTVIFPPEVDTPMNIEEAKTLPAEGRAAKSFGGVLQPDHAARVIVEAIAREEYFFIPGLSTRLSYLLHRLTNGWSTRMVSDTAVRNARLRLTGRA